MIPFGASMQGVQLTPNMALYDVPNLLHGRMDGVVLSITIIDLIYPIIGFAIRNSP